MVGNPFKGLSNLAYVDAVNRSAALASVALLATNQSVFSKQISSTPKTSGSLWVNFTIKQGPVARIGFSKDRKSQGQGGAQARLAAATRRQLRQSLCADRMKGSPTCLEIGDILDGHIRDRFKRFLCEETLMAGDQHIGESQ